MNMEDLGVKKKKGKKPFSSPCDMFLPPFSTSRHSGDVPAPDTSTHHARGKPHRRVCREPLPCQVFVWGAKFIC